MITIAMRLRFLDENEIYQGYVIYNFLEQITAKTADVCTAAWEQSIVHDLTGKNAAVRRAFHTHKRHLQCAACFN